MLLSVLILGSALLLMSKYRVWLAFAAGGVVFAAALWGMMGLLVRFLPDELSVLAGMLSFLIVTGFIFWLVNAPESESVH